jgi:hypothetical protein
LGLGLRTVGRALVEVEVLFIPRIWVRTTKGWR